MCLKTGKILHYTQMKFLSNFVKKYISAEIGKGNQKAYRDDILETVARQVIKHKIIFC